MKTSTKQGLAIVIIVALALAIYAGSAFAQEVPTTTAMPAPTMLQRMQERLGPEGWNQMVQRMNQRFGAEFTGQMMQRMAQQENCPCLADESCQPGMGQGMMQQERNGVRGGMMGRGTMGRGAWDQDAAPWGFNRQMGPRFWNSMPSETPATAPTVTPAE